jgi:hypothetical protein
MYVWGYMFLQYSFLIPWVYYFSIIFYFKSMNLVNSPMAMGIMIKMMILLKYFCFITLVRVLARKNLVGWMAMVWSKPLKTKQIMMTLSMEIVNQLLMPLDEV